MLSNSAALVMLLTALNASADESQANIELQPVNMGMWAFAGDRYTRFLVLELPLAATFVDSSNRLWAFEVSPGFSSTRDSPFSDAEGGPAPGRVDRARLIVSGARWFRPLASGFFIGPKVMLVLAAEGSSRAAIGASPPTPPLRQPAAQTSLGFDVGYRWEWERWSLTAITGVSFGYVFAAGQPNRGLFGSLISPLQHLPGPRDVLPPNAVVDPNLNLIRVGARF